MAPAQCINQLILITLDVYDLYKLLLEVSDLKTDKNAKK